MPKNLDGVDAAPECHRVMYEEGGIRVLEVVVAAGQREPIHTHEYGAILIAVERARLLYEVFDWVDGAWVTVSSEERVTTPYAARWIESEPPHALTSLDDVTFKAIRVEFLEPGLGALVSRMRLDLDG
ncbi:MAG: hypothetical protein ACR2QO_03685 [Acidimicrobiales bacterium]